MKKILITGITGFIGSAVLDKIINDYDITALIRPKTDLNRYNKFKDKIKLIEINLSDLKSLKEFLHRNSFDIILHIGALRGGRKFAKEEYQKANVFATEQLIINAAQNNSKFIFCSSVGVFGAIPLELPANNLSPRQEDNFYHTTKIRCENLIQKFVLSHNLNACIIRPAITYGTGDYGFPFTLCKLIDKKILFLPDRPIRIHMTHIDLISQAFVNAINIDFKPGSAWNVADQKPVVFSELTDFISNQIHHQNYPKNRRISKSFFEIGESIARFFKNELWVSRFELISKNWFYDVSDSYKDLHLESKNTIPEFSLVIDWYKNRK
jgi:nucleoside-diphosphate-sugar epimerase